MDRRRKRELRDLNTRVWAGEKDIFPTNGSLDSSLKKNTAFIRRLRTALVGSSTSTFLQEIRSLSLQKYLSEVISATSEGLCKLKTSADIAAGVEVVSGLHQRFGPEDFTSYLAWHIGRGLTTPDKATLKALSLDAREKEEKDRLARHKVLLKVVTELWLTGIVRNLDDAANPDGGPARAAKDGASSSKASDIKAKAMPSSRAAGEAEPFPLEVLKDLLGHDREHANLPLVVLFVKGFAWDILAVHVVDDRPKQPNDDGGASVPTADVDDPGSPVEDDAAANGVSEDPPLTSPEMQQRFRNVLERYLEDVKKHVLKDQKALVTQGKRNAEAYVKSGEKFEDREANYDRQVKAQEKLVSSTQFLCEALGSDMPDLKDKDANDGAAAGGIGLVKAGEFLRGQSEGAGIWEDEEERRFYENLVDLKDRVPGVLLEEQRKKKDEDEQVGKRKDADGADGDKAVDPTDDQSTSIANKTVGAQVDTLLARLPEVQNKDQVDQVAIDFCFLNSKASRNRLIKAVEEVPKGRSDLLPLYSRLVATIGKYLKDVSAGLVDYLDDEFRSLQRRKSKDFLGQVRTGNIRYLAELTKFGVVPEHVIFHCLKVSLDDFSRMNIEIIGNLLENCGRYLLRNPETSPRMQSFLETLQRKKTATHLAQQERMIIENAIYYVNPPERAAIQQKERTPTELYVRQLVYLDMNKRTYAKVLKSIRKLHWEEAEVVDILRKIFAKPGKIKYSNIGLLAILLSALWRYHQSFVVEIVDTVLENITLGLEQNDFKYNQRRLAEVRYLGELYSYKMVDSQVIFDTLYRIVTFGHPNGTPAPGNVNVLDLPDDFFRVRLICAILDTCGDCFDRGQAKQKLDFFLTFFQYYLHTKQALPMDIEFLVHDTLTVIRPKWKLAEDLEEAGKAFAEAVAQNYNKPQRDVEPDPEPELDPEPEDVDSSDEAEGGDLEAPEMQRQSSSEEGDVEGDQIPSDGIEMDDGEEEHIVVKRQEEERDPEADAEFDRELAKLMAESASERKTETRRPAVFDVPLPMRPRPAQREDSPTREGEPATPLPATMAFSLMTKKGNRQLDLPSDSTFAMAARKHEEAERAERARIKNLVLNYDMQEDDGSGLDNHLTPGRINSERQQRGNRTRKLQLSDVDWT